MLGLINNKNFNKSFKNLQKKNFPYVVIDNFFKKNIAIKLEKEFPKYENKILHEYKNFCEIKKSLNNWNIFPPLTYKTFTILNSNEVIKLLTKKLKLQKMYADFGLNGGGWHMMNKKGKLNPHLDYFIHPKINKQRKFNLIIFLTNGWREKWGGELCFYKENKKDKKLHGELFKKIYPKFNRAVFFDVSMNSWHGVNSIKVNKIRKSIAVYYLVNPKKNEFNIRKKALYAPTKNQINKKNILKFIKLRSNAKSFSKVYK